MRFRRPVKVVERKVHVPDFKSEEYDKLSKAITVECRNHQPEVGGEWGPGWGGLMRFHCSKCRTPWPCWFLRWAASVYGMERWVAEPLTYDPTIPPGRK